MARTVTIKGHDNVKAFLGLQGEDECKPKTTDEEIMQWAMRVHLAVHTQDSPKAVFLMKDFGRLYPVITGQIPPGPAQAEQRKLDGLPEPYQSAALPGALVKIDKGLKALKKRGEKLSKKADGLEKEADRLGLSKSPPRPVGDKRFCYHVSEDHFVKGEGYRALIVYEGDPGPHLTGDWPFKAKLGQTRPYFWGRTADSVRAREPVFDIEKARGTCKLMNERMGVSPEDAEAIVRSSIVKSLKRSR